MAGEGNAHREFVPAASPLCGRAERILMRVKRGGKDDNGA